MSDSSRHIAAACELIKALLATEDGRFPIAIVRNAFWFCVIGLVALKLQNFVLRAWLEVPAASQAVHVPTTIENG